jgi:hypothetical protein
MRGDISEGCIYDIIEMTLSIFLNVPYMILLKWGGIYVWNHFMWYYEKERLYMSECFYIILPNWGIV